MAPYFMGDRKAKLDPAGVSLKKNNLEGLLGGSLFLEVQGHPLLLLIVSGCAMGTWDLIYDDQTNQEAIAHPHDAS